MNLRWFISKTVREASAMRKHVRNILNAQRDLLSAPAVTAVSDSLGEIKSALDSGAPREELRKLMEKLEECANKWLKPYPHAGWRENVEVLLVAIAVAMAIRTFFLQPFKIPTGSMQPTLFGVTSTPDFSSVSSESEFQEQMALRNFLTPTSGLTRVREWFAGASYLVYRTDEGGVFEGMSRPLHFFIFNVKQTAWISGRPKTIWFPPDTGGGAPYQWGNIFGLVKAMFSPLPPETDPRNPIPDLERRIGLRRGRELAPKEEFIRIKVTAGDHLFVDRLTYNFRKPKRGEIIVFQTAGIDHPRMPQDQFYIKRLVALSGENVQIGNDRHLRINGQRLDASTPHFENVYSFNPNKPPHESEYSGHVNEFVAERQGRPSLAPLYPTEDTVVHVSEHGYQVMGDNTMNSFDSRSWGDFPAANVIGKSFFIYWPITKRFGWGYH